MQEDNHQFSRTYLETTKKFLDVENRYYGKIDLLNKELANEEARQTSSYNADLQDLHKKRDAEVSTLRNKVLGLVEKAKGLVASASLHKDVAPHILRKIPRLTDLLPTAKSEQSYENDLEVDASLESLMETMLKVDNKAAEDWENLKEAISRLLLFRKKRSKIRAIIFAIAPVVVLAVFALSFYNLHLLYNGYKRANTTLEQKNWGLVNSEIEKLKIARGFRRLIMPIFFGESSYNRIFKTLGISESNIKDVEFTLLQREGYYRAGMEAYSSQNWQEAINIFKKIEQLDKVNYTFTKFPEQYVSKIIEHQQERGLEYFDNTATLLSKSQSQYNKINENK